MTCVVLAAGYATRLYPLTENFPKPLLEVGGKTILDYLTQDICKNCRIDDFVLVSNHRYLDSFEKWAAKSDLDVRILDDGSTDNSNRLGAVRDIDFAIRSLDLKNDLLVIAADNVLEFSFCHFLDFFEKYGTTCIMRWYEPELEQGRRYCVCSVDQDNRVLEMKEKVLNPSSHWLVPPFYIYKAADLHFVPEALEAGCPADAPGSLIEWLAPRTPIHAMPMPGKRYDIGDLAGYEKVCSQYRGISMD